MYGKQERKGRYENAKTVELVTFSGARFPVTKRRLYHSLFNVCVESMKSKGKVAPVSFFTALGSGSLANDWLNQCPNPCEFAKTVIAFLRWNTNKSMKILIWTCQCDDFLQNSYLSFDRLVFDKLGAI